MIFAAQQHAAQYATATVASVSLNAYQDAINATVLHAAAQLIVIILVAVSVFAVLANAILEEDATHLAIMYVIMTAK